MNDGPEPRVAVIIASLGRAQILGQLLDDLATQTRPPDRVIVAVCDPRDLPSNLADHAGVRTVVSPRGSCHQRNAALDDLAGESDIVFFCDDDYVPSTFAIERLVRFFARNPEVAGVTGHLLADGVNSPGISHNAARAMLDAYDSRPYPPVVPFRDLAGLYGCNMAFRTKAIGAIRFDERLRLYGWQEDIDFSAQVAEGGRIVKSFAFAGVHRGVKAGRSPGVRIGYSQVVNPAYLVRKGTMPVRYAFNIVLRNVFANHFRAIGAEPWVDRIGRVRGNWCGIADLLRGRVTPERVETL